MRKQEPRKASASDPALDHESRGVIVLTSSICATDGQEGHIGYSASKAGINAMVLPAARDLGASKIRVVGLSPGSMDTPIIAAYPKELLPLDTIPHPQRVGRPCEFASLVEMVFGQPMLNGEIIRLDGGIRGRGSKFF